MGVPVSGSPNFIKPKPEDTSRKDILRHVSRFQDKQVEKKLKKFMSDGKKVFENNKYGVGCLGQLHKSTKS